jgi:hypothetical protein
MIRWLHFDRKFDIKAELRLVLFYTSRKSSVRSWVHFAHIKNKLQILIKKKMIKLEKIVLMEKIANMAKMVLFEIMFHN